MALRPSPSLVAKNFPVVVGKARRHLFSQRASDTSGSARLPVWTHRGEGLGSGAQSGPRCVALAVWPPGSVPREHAMTHPGLFAPPTLGPGFLGLSFIPGLSPGGFVGCSVQLGRGGAYNRDAPVSRERGPSPVSTRAELGPTGHLRARNPNSDRGPGARNKPSWLRNRARAPRNTALPA